MKITKISANTNFIGKVHLLNDVKKKSPRSEISQLKRFAKEIDYDVLIFKRDHYCSGVGVYKGLVADGDYIAPFTYDCKQPRKNDVGSFISLRNLE